MVEPLLRSVHGIILRRARQQQGKTLGEIALVAGISTQYLSEIERGCKEPSSEILAAVCRALGWTLLNLTSAAQRQYLDLNSRNNLSSVSDARWEVNPAAAAPSPITTAEATGFIALAA